MGSSVKTILLKNLKPAGLFSKPVFLDKGYVLLSPETPVSAELVNRLAKWEFREVITEGGLVDGTAPAAEPGLEKEAPDKMEGAFVVDGTGDKERLESIRGYLEDYTSYVENLYSRFVTNSLLKYPELVERIRQLCELLVDNRRFVLRALSLIPPNRNYLISHAVTTSILSILLGTTLRMPLPRIMELGTAAILHEIGMVKLPPNLFMTNRQLTPEEKRRVTAHTVLGFTILKELQLPLAVQLAALEHHERVNSSGYPRGISGDHISLYAKIIMVACSYDAVTAARPHREGRESHEGILDLLRNEGHQYDELIIRALVLTLSIYPIGSFVMLTNGNKAVVIDTTPENPRFPLVQVLGSQAPDGSDVKVKTSDTGIRILRALNKEEIAAIRQ